ncbi:MAG: tetratricopeptide repeat protein, partial [Planctomycetota bacterium]|nr:tetratricopeptide repeat protein [Planctomycetota bacterium]
LAHRAGENEAAAKLLSACPPPSSDLVTALPLLHGEVYCDLGKFDAALAVLEKVNPEKAENDVKASLLYLTAVAYRGAGNLPGALKSFDAAGAVASPVRARSLLDAARVAVQMEKPADAVGIIQRCLALKDAETEPVAAMLGGDLSYRLNQFPQAVSFYQRVITNHQSTSYYGPAVLGSLWAQLSAKQYDAVLKTWESLRPSLGAADGFNADYIAASAVQSAGKHDLAIARLTALLATAPTPEQPRDKVAYKLALSQFELGKFDDMTKTLTGFATTYPQSPLEADAEYLQAIADVKKGDPAGGAARLTAIIAQGERNPYLGQALLSRGKLYEATTQPAPAMEDYKAFLALNAKPAPAPGMITEASLRLADLQAGLGQFEASEKTAAALLARPGIDPTTEQDGLYRQGVALVKQQKFEPAYAVFNTLLTKHPQNRYLPEAHYYRGLLLAGLQKADEAVPDLLEAGASNLPDPLRIQALRVASIPLRNKNDERAIKVLQQLAALTGVPGLMPDETLWLARKLAQMSQPAEALKVLVPLLDPKSAAPGPARSEAAFIAGMSLRETKDFPGALDAFRSVGALKHGYELEARLEMARTLDLAGQTEPALSEFGSLISVEPTDIASASIFDAGQIHRRRANEQKLANQPDAQKKSLEEARKLFKRLVLLYPFPQLSPLPELSYLELAEIEAELQNPTAVAAELKELTERFADGPYALYAKAVLAQQQNRKEEAGLRLKELHGKPLDPRLARRVERRLQSLDAPR